MNRSTKEDMQKRPSTDNQNLPMEYIAGPIEAYCQADGVFGQDRYVAFRQRRSVLASSPFLSHSCQHQTSLAHGPVLNNSLSQNSAIQTEYCAPLSNA